MKELVFIAISFFLGIICIRYITTYDKHEKEPFFRMLAVVCWGGVWSIIIATLLYTLVARLGAGELANALGALFVIGPVEELAKLLAFFSGYFLVRKEMDEPVDGIIYMSCVALGFSLIENYFYAMAPGSGHLLFFRLFISTPMHICFSAFMGLAAYIVIRNKQAWGLLLFAFALASISHGIYDLVIFNGWALLLLVAVMRAIYYWTMDLLSYATANSPYRTSLKTFIQNHEQPPLQQGIPCLNCGSDHSKATYRRGKIYIQKCDGCDLFVTTRKSLLSIFHHFAATFKNVSKKHIAAAFRNKSHFISKKKKIAAFDLDALDLTLEALNKSIIAKMEKKWWLPGNLMQLQNPDERFDYTQMAADGGAAVWRWLIYPFSADKAKRLHVLPQSKPVWNWGAFLLPELWYLYHELWGVFFLIIGLYGAWIYSGLHWHWPIFGQKMLLLLLVIHLLSGRFGNDIYYTMHGKWPIASWNRKAGVNRSENVKHSG